MTAVGIVGLGNMGSAIAERLVGADRAVVGYDISVAAREGLARVGGHPVDSAAAVAQQADHIVLSLPSTAALDAVVSGDGGIAEAAHSGHVVIETSTLPIEAKSCARTALAQHRAQLLDCAVSGTPASTRAGELALYASGDRQAFDRVEQTLLAFNRSIRFAGDFGAATGLKLICNLLVVIHEAAAAEAMSLGINSGFDPQLVYEVVCEGIASSRIFEQRARMMVTGDYRPGSRTFILALKDCAMIDALARDAQAFSPLFALARQLHVAALGQGLGELDGAALLEVYRAASSSPQGSDARL